MSAVGLHRLRTLIGEKRADCYFASECYIANVRSFLSGREDAYRVECAGSLNRWIELMRECVAEYDAQRSKPRT